MSCKGAEVRFQTSNANASLAALTSLLATTKAELLELQVRKATLEDVFLRLTKEGEAAP